MSKPRQSHLGSHETNFSGMRYSAQNSAVLLRAMPSSTSLHWDWPLRIGREAGPRTTVAGVRRAARDDAHSAERCGVVSSRHDKTGPLGAACGPSCCEAHSSSGRRVRTTIRSPHERTVHNPSAPKLGDLRSIPPQLSPEGRFRCISTRDSRIGARNANIQGRAASGDSSGSENISWPGLVVR